MAKASKTQIDRLGDRLKKGAVEEPDLILLDSYRRSFGTAYETVVQTIRTEIELEPTGRPAKSTNSLIEKLKRESIRLTQVQDIAGCRLVVSDTSNKIAWLVRYWLTYFPRLALWIVEKNRAMGIERYM